MSLPAAFLAAVAQLVPAERRFDDPLSTLAFGTDASFYRLIPQLVLRVESEAEVVGILLAARAQQVSVTFRAAGTSLSGQAITDSVLIVLGDNWGGRTLLDGGQRIRLQPGVIGASANSLLAPLQRKIGPDPASINAAKIGGIVANNSSGMCCGTAQNSYHTLAGMRLVLADGTVLDSEDAASVAAFRASHAEMLQQLAELGRQTRANTELAARIRHKYRLKNTTGLSINALTDFDDPLDILLHLMVGSEGILGFISSVTYHTVPDHPHKATALLVFPDVDSCCRAVPVLRQQPVAAVELLDRRSLRSVENMAGMPEWVAALSNTACALLVESRAATPSLLDEQVGQIMAALQGFTLEKSVPFSTDPAVSDKLWKIRKDTFPAVGAVRPVGSTVIIEDVTFPVEQLAEGVHRLLELFERHNYHEAIIFGHALEGNLHFVFTQRFDSEEEKARYAAFMDDVAQLVAVECGGALKAEHGTGRNMAPFVPLEWGNDAWELMWQIKHLLDPAGILNPDVVLSRDKDLHLKNLKPLPAADDLVDRCIECGFCEPVCPSKGLTLTPRQRIVIWRDIQARKRAGVDTSKLEQAWQHYGLDSCAATGLCAQRCPVGINTGDLVRKLRGVQAHSGARASWLADHFATTLQASRTLLSLATTTQRLLGAPRLSKLSQWARALSGERLPLWTPAMPTPVRLPADLPTAGSGDRPRVVYLPSCASRAMGPALGDAEQRPLLEVTRALLEKAGYQVVFPPNVDELCCGQPFASKGYPEQADAKRQQMLDALMQASRGGLDPILSDTSPCSLRLGEKAPKQLQLFDSVAFIHDQVAPRLDITPIEGPIAAHVTCSTRKMGLEKKFIALAELCAKQVVIPEDVQCCGFAGDKGFTLPALNSHALRTLRDAVQHCEQGVSTSRTCEVGLSSNSGIEYHGLVQLLDRVSRAKT